MPKGYPADVESRFATYAAAKAPDSFGHSGSCGALPGRQWQGPHETSP